MEFVYAIRTSTTTPCFQINMDIGEGGVCGNTFSKEFYAVAEAVPQKITIWFNSLGGGVKDAYTIFTTIANCGVPTKSVIAGFACSSAGWIPLAADEVEVYDYSTWMCHLPYNKNDPDKQTSFLNMVAVSIANIISAKSGKNGKTKKTPEDVLEMMNSTTYMTASELYDAGLVDKVIVSSEKIVLNKENYAEQQALVNSLLIPKNKEKQSEMLNQEILNKLGLATGSGDVEVINKIASFENKIADLNNRQQELNAIINGYKEKETTLNTQIVTLQTEKATLVAEKTALETAGTTNAAKVEELNNKIGELSAKVTEAENAQKAAEEVALNQKIDATVEGLLLNGKVKNEEKTIEGVKNAFRKNFDDTFMIFDNLPVNMHTPKVVSKDTLIIEAEEGTPEWYRAQNKLKLDNKLKAEKDALLQMQNA